MIRARVPGIHIYMSLKCIQPPTDTHTHTQYTHTHTRTHTHTFRPNEEEHMVTASTTTHRHDTTRPSMHAARVIGAFDIFLLSLHRHPTTHTSHFLTSSLHHVCFVFLRQSRPRPLVPIQKKAATFSATLSGHWWPLLMSSPQQLRQPAASPPMLLW